MKILKVSYLVMEKIKNNQLVNQLSFTALIQF